MLFCLFLEGLIGLFAGGAVGVGGFVARRASQFLSLLDLFFIFATSSLYRSSSSKRSPSPPIVKLKEIFSTGKEDEDNIHDLKVVMWKRKLSAEGEEDRRQERNRKRRDLIQENVAINQHEAIQKFIEGTVADGVPVIPVSVQFKYNNDVVCEYIVKKIPNPERNFISPPNMIVIRSFDVNKPGFEVDEIRGSVAGGVSFWHVGVLGVLDTGTAITKVAYFGLAKFCFVANPHISTR